MSKFKLTLILNFLLISFSLNAEDSLSYQHELNSAALGMRPFHTMVNPAAPGFFDGSELTFEAANHFKGLQGERLSLSYGTKLFPGFHLFFRTAKYRSDENSKISVIAFNNYEQTLLKKELDSYGLNSYGFAFSENGLSIGFRYDSYISGYDQELNKVGSWNFGLGLHFFPLLSFSYVSNNFNQPSFYGEELKNSHILSLGLNLLDENLSLAWDYEYSPGYDKWFSHYYARIKPLKGLFLGLGYDEKRKMNINAELNLGEYTASGKAARSSEDDARYGSAAFSINFGTRNEAMLEVFNKAFLVELSGNYEYVTNPSIFSRQKDYYQLITTLKNAVNDESIDSIILNISELSMGLGRISELRSIIEKAKINNKQVKAVIEYGGDNEYYLASVADEIIMKKHGGMLLNGLSMRNFYLKDSLSKIGVKAQFVKIGEYKNAPDIFTENKMSEGEKEANHSLLNSLLNEIYKQIDRSQYPLNAFKEILESNYLVTAQKLKQAGLVDRLIPGGATIDNLEKIVGPRFELVSEEYVNHKESYSLETGLVFAVIYIKGAIFDGYSSNDPFMSSSGTGSKTIVQQISRIKEDKRIKGLLLRIDSPGGSAMASNEIWDAIMDLKKEKPVVAHLGDVAASGGYYVASAANKIISSPGTITGSIGIYTGKFDISGLHEKTEIKSDVIKTHESADLFDLSRAWTDKEIKKIQEIIKYGYDDFLRAVSLGRGMKTEKVDELGKGRIWSGIQSKRIGLSDGIGDIFDAVTALKELARFSDRTPAKLYFYPDTNYLSSISSSFKVELKNLGKSLIKDDPISFLLHEQIFKTNLSYLYLSPGKAWALMPRKIEIR